MSRHYREHLVWLLCMLMAATGCHPTQPFYFQEDGDLSHYLAHATEVDHPDVEDCLLPDTTEAQRPLSVANPEFKEFWDLTLEEAVSIHLHNSKVLRGLGGLPSPINTSGSLVPDRLITNPESQVTIYDPSIFETNPRTGVAAALSAFDAQFTIDAGNGQNVFWDLTNRPQNIDTGNPFFPQIIQNGQGQVTTGITKRSAVGTQFAARNITGYNRGNQFGATRALSSFWSTAMEIEVNQPLLRNAGTQINRIPVLLARINTDVSIADFEGAVRNSVFDVEKAYWDLYAAYRNLEAQKTGRDSALVTWRIVYEKWRQGVEPVQAEAQAREQYFLFRARVEESITDLYNTESNMRFLLGLAATDGRLIRPTDEPTMAKLEFDWFSVHNEALARSVELRRQKWLIKQRELELIAARNQLLPQFNVRGIYRWVGLGDDLLGGQRDGANFPQLGSKAWDDLTEGDYQEYSIGFVFQPPAFGARAELDGIRNAQLRLHRDKARLEDMELNVSHLLARAVRDMESQYSLAESHFNRLVASVKEVESAQALYKGGKQTLDVVLDAQRRRSDAEVAFYQALTSYHRQIAHVHYRKGSLLEYNGVQLAEGPWPHKAYWDALGHARRRDASYYFNYGWTRPSVVSQGPVDQQSGGAAVGQGVLTTSPETTEPVEHLQDGPDNGAPTPAGRPGPTATAPTPAPARLGAASSFLPPLPSLRGGATEGVRPASFELSGEAFAE